MSLLTKIFGDYSQKELKRIEPLVKKVLALEEEYAALSDEELKAKTPYFKERLANGETTDDILCEAFAVAKNACRRLCGTTVTVTGHEMVWNMVPFDVQLIGGTKVNDSFQRFYEKVQVLNTKANEIQDKIKINQAVNQEVTSYYDQMQDLQDKYVEYVKSSIIDNSDNAFGFHQLMDSYDLFEPSEIMGFIEALSPTFGHNADLLTLAELINVQMATSEGRQFIDFELPLLKNGNADLTAKLSDYAGKKKVVLLDFWASWCEPCRRSIPGLKELYAKYAPMGFEIVSVSVDTNHTSWMEAVEEEGMTWPQLIDSSNGDANSPATKYAVMAIPSTFLIDSDGTIIARNLVEDELAEALEDIFK